MVDKGRLRYPKKIESKFTTNFIAEKLLKI